jgi:hypothetical protein
MKKKMVAIWALMLIIGAIPMSCDLFCRDSCGCKPLPPPKKFSIKDLNIQDFVLGNSAFNKETFYPKDQYFKSINVMDFEFISQNQESKMSYFFITGVYACSPIPPSSIQTFTEIKIINKKEITLSDNNLVLKDQEITDKFLISNYPRPSGENITYFLENEQWIFMGEPFYLRWEGSISNETELTFDVFIKLDDGQEYFFEEEVMKIK